MPSPLMILTTGRADGGKKATLTFHLGIGALSLGDEVTVRSTPSSGGPLTPSGDEPLYWPP